MYICLCNGITDRDINAAVRDGVRTMQQLQEVLRVSVNCGSCREITEQLLRRQCGEALNHEATIT